MLSQWQEGNHISNIWIILYSEAGLQGKETFQWAPCFFLSRFLQGGYNLRSAFWWSLWSALDWTLWSINLSPPAHWVYKSLGWLHLVSSISPSLTNEPGISHVLGRRDLTHFLRESYGWRWVSTERKHWEAKVNSERKVNSSFNDVSHHDAYKMWCILAPV